MQTVFLGISGFPGRGIKQRGDLEGGRSKDRWEGGTTYNVQMEVSRSHGKQPGLFPWAEISN